MQEMVKAGKCCTNIGSISKSNKRVKPVVKSRLSDTTEYFLSGLSYDSNKKRNPETTQELFKEFENGFNDIRCFKETFSLQLKPDSKPYQMSLRRIAYILQKPSEEELESYKKGIIAPLVIDEISEWCNSFVLVPKVNGKVRLCLDPAQLNQALIRPIHRGPTLNDILPKINNAKYISFINESSGYHNLKLDERSCYFTMFACQFGIYRYKKLAFGAAPAGNMLQRKIMKYLRICQMYSVLQMIYQLQGMKLMERIITKQYGDCCRDVDKLI